ncbi:hypothetical protein TL16_g10749 [Triparma laevis f. inornata]|uniref:Uncharacterized protein n=2 Tax=Triparma laevis TaxID=1534972 RepID=A0A9W7AG91_9STRA|nr:hypothetical protein TrLO_g14701 [Triparma laevis f. longispina]GMH87097.1 hypothetical protein TL16_g10749 [Triparma laevis f. inornata]
MSRSPSPSLPISLIGVPLRSFPPFIAPPTPSLCSTSSNISDSSELASLDSLKCFDENLTKSEPVKPLSPHHTPYTPVSPRSLSLCLETVTEGLLQTQISTFALSSLSFSPTSRLLLILFTLLKRFNLQPFTDYEDEQAIYYDGEDNFWSSHPWLHPLLFTLSSLLPLYLSPSQTFVLTFFFLYQRNKTCENERNRIMETIGGMVPSLVVCGVGLGFRFVID